MCLFMWGVERTMNERCITGRAPGVSLPVNGLSRDGLHVLGSRLPYPLLGMLVAANGAACCVLTCTVQHPRALCSACSCYPMYQL